MMKTKRPNITEVHVDPPSFESTSTAAGFTYKGARYHVWFRFDIFKLDRGGKLYKNLIDDPRPVRDRRPQRLDPHNATNAPLLAEMWRQIGEGDMIAKAIAESERIEDVRLADAHAAYILNRKKEAGPQLYEACVEALAFLDNLREPPPVARANLYRMLNDAVASVESPEPESTT